VTGAFGTAGVEVHHTRHFLDDARRLPEVLVRKVDEAVIKIRSQGIYQSGLLAEKVHGNPDGRFRFLRVDLQYRMVAVAEGRDIMLMKVGNHDETDRWGTTATLSGELLGGKQVRLVDHDHHPPVALGLLGLEQLRGLGHHLGLVEARAAAQGPDHEAEVPGASVRCRRRCSSKDGGYARTDRGRRPFVLW